MPCTCPFAHRALSLRVDGLPPPPTTAVFAAVVGSSLTCCQCSRSVRPAVPCTRFVTCVVVRAHTRAYRAPDVPAHLPDLIGVLQDDPSVRQLSIIRFVRLARLVKLMRVLRVGRIFKRWESTMNIHYSVLSLAKFVGCVALAARPR